jgi:ketosteroid isomerase-like protein
MEHPNAALMRKVDEALLAGDFPGFLALHTEDAVMHVPGTGPLSGDPYGRDGIAAVFQQEMSMLDAPPEIVPLDDLGSDDHAALSSSNGCNAGVAHTRAYRWSSREFATDSCPRSGSGRRIKPHSTSSSPNASSPPQTLQIQRASGRATWP